MKLHVETMYGCGWRDSSRGVADVAPPFDVEAVLTVHNGFRAAVGCVDQPGHPFFNMWVALSPFPVVKEGAIVAFVCSVRNR
jgi:hypothetical protein